MIRSVRIERQRSKFEAFCRQAGLMIHHVLEPLTSRGGRGRRTVVKTEEKVAPDVVLRRTTIDEIEVRREDT